jgi:hypothetical protein
MTSRLLFLLVGSKYSNMLKPWMIGYAASNGLGRKLHVNSGLCNVVLHLRSGSNRSSSLTIGEFRLRDESGSRPQWRPAAKTLLNLTKAGLLPIHVVAECGWSLLAHRAFERTVLFALDEDPTVITQRVRETIEE